MEVVDARAVMWIGLLSLGTACLSLFAQECMEVGQVFGRYRLFLLYWWGKWWRKKDRNKRLLLKPLGLCIYCFSSWVFICLYLISVSQICDWRQLTLGLFIGLGFNFIWIKILEKWFMR